MGDVSKFYMVIAFTLAVSLVAYGVLLSPPFKPFRERIGLMELEGTRYNESAGGADIINPHSGEIYLGRITFMYHSVFAILLFGSFLVFARIYLKDSREAKHILDLMFIGVLLTLLGGVAYGYITRDFLFHGLFIAGLSFIFASGLLTLKEFRPKGMMAWNIYISGILLLLGGIIGGWLGASFMEHRKEFLHALIESRFTPSLAEENVYWRALTAHEHAMMALALVFVFFIALSLVKLKGGKTTKYLLYLAIPSQIIMALASYSVWFFGAIAHLAITPAAILLIFSTLMLSFRVEEWNLIKLALLIGNAIMWVGVAIPGALVAMSLRKPLFFNPAFRDEMWDWAELAYNIGHWHILLLTWGVILFVIYIIYPISLGKMGKIAGYLTLGGYLIASIGINLYMLGNPPGAYSPNPYDNIFLKTIVEPALGMLSLGVALGYLTCLKEFLRGFKEAN
ncbi:MAG: hypothetical protein H0Z28_04995 [Archaeoglobus sp.]|nr:hypothetical protein [Archaeoglobus sp.]